MPVVIPDEILKQAGLTEREALIEIACRLFAAQKLDKHAASRLCGLTRVQFESELCARDLPLIFYTEEMLQQDLRAITELQEIREREGGRAGRQ